MNNSPKLILLVGISGAGKTTYAQQYVEKHSNTIHLSSDEIRAELWGDPSIQDNPYEVFSLMQKRAVEALNNGQNVVYDATGITRKDRAGIISVCPKFVKIECHIVWAPIEICIERDAARERSVGKEVIDRMLKRFQAPFFDEGIADIQVIRPNDFDQWEYVAYIERTLDIPHDNPYHSLDIKKHCVAAFNRAVANDYDENLCIAALYHDAAKPYVKAFVDAKGNPCETAHYYQHHCVGAWIGYGISLEPEIAWLISTHMDVFLNTKYYNNLPTYLKKRVDQLHACDVAAH